MSIDLAHSPSPITAALARRVQDGADARSIGARVALVWQAIDATLSPVIGTQGVAALYSRSVHVCLSAHPWLDQTGSGIELAINFDAITQVLAKQPATDAATGGGSVLQAFWSQLTEMVGASLTQELLGTVWANELDEGANSVGDIS